MTMDYGVDAMDVGGPGSRLFLDDGRAILDASGRAAVSCLGHGDERVVDAVARQMRQVAYCSSFSYTTPALEQLCELLVASTGGRLSRACIVSSGG
jgi:adenosylmethionine-8-amino-7-oxononanoate aminotransferase